MAWTMYGAVRGEESHPGAHCVIRHAGLGEGRQVCAERHALDRADGDDPHAPRGHLARDERMEDVVGKGSGDQRLAIRPRASPALTHFLTTLPTPTSPCALVNTATLR